MKRCLSLIFALMAVCACIALAQEQTAKEEIKQGVVIEQVAKASEAERAKIQEGDTILRWTRGDASGNIENPFDLGWIEIEQAQRGPVKLEGVRNNQKLTWTVGSADWGITSRPNLEGTLLSIYNEGQELAKAGKLTDAAERWRNGAARPLQNREVSAWFLFHSAETFTGARLWKEADNAYQNALEAGAGPLAAAQVLRRRGRVFQMQHDWKDAEKYFRQAMAEGEKVSKEGLFVARCLHNVGGIFIRQGDINKAEELYLRAFTIRQKLAPDSLDMADSFDVLALVEGERGNVAKAEEYSRKEVAIAERSAPGSIDLAIDYNNLGYTILRKGDLDAADSFLQRALALEEELQPEDMGTASTLTNLGDIAWQQGNLSKAENYHRRSLEIRQKVAPGGLEVSAGFNNLGLIYRARGDLAAAEKFYLQSVAILEKLAPASYEMATALDNLGALHWYRLDLDMADQYYRRSLAIWEKLAPDSLQIAGTLGSMGSLAQQKGDWNKAREDYSKALSIVENIAPNSLDAAGVLNQLGGLEQEQKNDREARQYHERALAIEEKLAPQGSFAAQTLSHLGDLAANQNDLARAEAYYRRALEIREKLSARNTDYAESSASLASFLRRKGQIDEAAKLYGRALDALEEQITLLGGGEEISFNVRAMHAGYYKDYIDLLVQQKQSELAFHVLERLRARELLKILAAHTDIGKNASNPLFTQQRSLAADIAAKSTRRARLLGAEHTEDQVFTLDREIRALQAQLDEVNTQIRKSNPDYAALTQPQPFTAREVQQHLLDPDTVLLEYGLGEERSYLWLVAPDFISMYELPKRSEIEPATRKLREILIARNAISKGETDVDRMARAKKADAEYPAAAAKLSGMLLNPVASRIEHKRLLIVSDGVLQYIPFAALPMPGNAAGGSSAAPPLIRDHEVVNLPSASVLGVLKQQTAGRAAAAKTVAVLADPVFDVKDERVRTAQASSPKPKAAETVRSGTDDALFSDRLSSSLLLRSASEIGMITGQTPFPRLLFARAEAEAILQGIPTGQGLKALDFAASRATAISQQLYDYRIVHFATHGLLNSEHPELSGLVLSLVDEQGKEQNGFLGLKDIYNLTLRADLVVLSACETGLGKEIQGEGLVGVARGFMYAGASSVVASLWKVDDLATAEFMKVFYKGMLNDKLRPAAALRRAQLAMSKRRPSPYFWAGFVLQGQP